MEIEKWQQLFIEKIFRKIRMIFDIEFHFESQILAVFDEA